MTNQQSLISLAHIKKLALHLDTQRCYAMHEGKDETAKLLNKQVLECWDMFFELQDHIWE